MPVQDEVRGDGADTALAGALERVGGVAPGGLARCLAELRVRREREPGLSLAALLLERGLADAAVLERARAHLVAGVSGVARSSFGSSGELGRRPRLPDRIGPYRVLRELARGGMGVVLEVEHEATGARYALKTVLSQHDPDALLRFRREAELLARLEHPHVVRVHAAELDARPPWFVVALLPGGTLARRMHDGGPLAPAAAVPLVATLARAMAHAHERGVLHRDLKPENVLFDDQGAPCLVDFGLARDTDAGACRLTLTGDVLGTPSFMAPEQALGVKADPRTDVWGLGAILFAALTGRPPFDGTSPFAVLEQVLTQEPIAPGRLRPGIPPALDALVLRALAREPAARFASANDLAAALEALVEASPPIARPRASWVVPLAAAAAISLAVAGLALFAARPREDGLPPPTESAPRVTAPLPSPSATQPEDAEPALLQGGDVLSRGRAAPLADVVAAIAWLERAPHERPIEQLRLAARLRATRTDLPAVDETHGRALFDRWIEEARRAHAGATQVLERVDDAYFDSGDGAYPDLGLLERLGEALGAALLLGRWNPYDVERDLAAPLLGLAKLTGADTMAGNRERLRPAIAVIATRTWEPLLFCAWVQLAGEDPQPADRARMTSECSRGLELLIDVMPAGPPATSWRGVHDVLVDKLRWWAPHTGPAFLLAEAARPQAGPRVLALAADALCGDANRSGSIDDLRRAWALLERVAEEDRLDGFHLDVRRDVDAVALRRAPSWFVDLPPHQRPPALLPPDVRWGERPGEYVRVSDGALLEWVAGAGFRVAR